MVHDRSGTAAVNHAAEIIKIFQLYGCILLLLPVCGPPIPIAVVRLIYMQCNKLSSRQQLHNCAAVDLGQGDNTLFAAG